jgi:protein-S-isoprenylcysteine O-methyltransferase Ste14
MQLNATASRYLYSEKINRCAVRQVQIDLHLATTTVIHATRSFMSDSTASEERRRVGMLFPPPILLAALIAVCVGAQVLWFGGFTYSPTRTALGLILLAASLALFVVCGKLFKIAGTPFRPISPATTIVKTGPYRFSRNPMYLAMAGLLAGLGILFGSFCFGAALVIFVVAVHFGVVLPEERYLESLLGETYLQYKRQVRRWL